MPCRTWQTYTQGLWFMAGVDHCPAMNRTPVQILQQVLQGQFKCMLPRSQPSLQSSGHNQSALGVCVCMCVSSNLQLQCTYKNTNAAYIYTQMHMYVYSYYLQSSRMLLLPFPLLDALCMLAHPASSTHRIVVVKKGRVLDVTFVLLPAAVLAHIKVRCWMPQPVEYSQRQQPTKQQSATTKQQRTCAHPPLPHTHHCAPVQVALELVAQKCLATASCGGNRGHGHDSSSGAQANITQQQQQHNIAQQHRAYASVSAMPNQILQPLTQANEDDSETLLLQSDALALDVAADEELVRVCGRARSGCCRRAFAPPPTHIQ